MITREIWIDFTCHLDDTIDHSIDIGEASWSDQDRQVFSLDDMSEDVRKDAPMVRPVIMAPEA